jgi:hypothetical protein
MTTTADTRPVRAPQKERTGRQMLTDLGIGQFNATMIIPYLWIAPAATDPKASQVILLVEKLQRQLAMMGAPVRMNGYIDLPTAAALSKVVGSRWETMPWASSISAVLSAKNAGLSIDDPEPDLFVPSGVGDIPGIPGLPDVPGGIVTYGIAAYLLYRHFKKR